jgi:hypothetical protein
VMCAHNVAADFQVPWLEISSCISDANIIYCRCNSGFA